MDQEWLVIDGQSGGFGGGFLPPDAADKPLKLYANASDELDDLIKDTLKAQGFPVKQGVGVYSRSILMYTPIPAETRSRFMTSSP